MQRSIFLAAAERPKFRAEGSLRSSLVSVGPRYAPVFYLLRETPADAYMHGMSALLGERNPVRELEESALHPTSPFV